MVQNAAARVLTRTRKYDHISPVLSTLHWLPIKHRIDFKILLITYKALNGLAPQYLSELFVDFSQISGFTKISSISPHLAIPMLQIVIKHLKVSLIVHFLRGLPSDGAQSR